MQLVRDNSRRQKDLTRQISFGAAVIHAGMMRVPFDSYSLDIVTIIISTVLTAVHRTQVIMNYQMAFK